MWFSRRSGTVVALVAPVEVVTCEHTLVVHADATLECEGAGEHGCGADALVHEWWVACDELGCGCVGEEHDGVGAFPVPLAA